MPINDNFQQIISQNMALTNARFAPEPAANPELFLDRNGFTMVEYMFLGWANNNRMG
jgi:hypothetical protein